MSINNKTQSISLMNELGSKGIPFVFLIDFEMKKIIVSTNVNNCDELKFDMNDVSNTIEYKNHSTSSFLEVYPIDKNTYARGFELVQSEIGKGNSFLLNLSYANKIITNLSLNDIYQSTQARYKVLLEDQFVCFSPEIFVQINDGKISSFPMKGTIDAAIPNAKKIILDDKKELAEHFTIVDLIRNDLSRVAKNVTVNRFRYIDKIKTSKKDLLQVSSEVSGQLPEDYAHRIGDIIFGLLPAGSISGAPKPKTLEIIREAEEGDRGYYTGICGHFDGKNLDSGVMIRFIEKKNDEYYYRSGGGITAMSDMDIEYQEMIDKVYLPSKKDQPSIATIKHISRNEN